MIRKITLLTATAAMFISVKASTVVNNIVSTSATWTYAGSPYYIEGNTIINEDVTITIEPGVRVISTGDYKILNKGEIRAIGKADSMISFESLHLELSSTAKEYVRSTGAGNRFDYVRFSAYANTGYCVSTAARDLGFDHCQFTFGTYGIYNNTGIPEYKLWVTDCKFTLRQNSYPIYGLYAKSSLYLTGSSLQNIGYFYLATENYVRNNFFSGTNSGYAMFMQIYTKHGDIQCNHFKGFGYGFYAYTMNTGIGKFVVRNNVFDSINYLFSFSCNNYFMDSVEIKHNNFSRFKYSFTFSGCSGSGNFKVTNYDSNFWNTTDTSVVLSTAQDFRKNVFVPWKVNIVEMLANAVPTCWPLNAGSTAGTRDMSQMENRVRLRPNPAGNTLQIQTGNIGTKQVVLFDLKGTKVKEIQFATDEYQMDMSLFPRGIYVVHCITVTGRTTQKLILE